MEKPMKVMLAEEGSEYGQTCANVLRSYGYEVTLVPKDGSEVISRLPIHTPDVLLMDMFMPHVDALGVMKALPELKLSKRPLIMLTSSVDNVRFEQEVLAAGADYYFLKPFDLDILAERIFPADRLEHSRSGEHTQGFKRCAGKLGSCGIRNYAPNWRACAYQGLSIPARGDHPFD